MKLTRQEINYRGIDLKFPCINPVKASSFRKIYDLEVSIMLVRLGSFNDLLERRNFKKLLLKLVLDRYVVSLVFQMKAGLR
jgi:hypothetical protein